MISSRTQVAIVEPSEITRIGIEHIIVSDPSFAITYSDSSMPLDVNCQVEIAIVNINSLLDVGQNRVAEMLPSARIIALAYSYTSREQRVKIGDIIEITDSSDYILKLLRQSESVEAEDKSSQRHSNSEELSEREEEVVAAVARGLINKEIADTLHISIHTVMAHRKNIARKTGIRSISGLVVYALLNGLISQDEVIK